MPYTRPTLSELVERTRNDLDARLPGADSRLRRSVLDVLGRVLSGAVSGLYGYLEWIARQILPDTSEGEILVRQAAIYGVARKAAQASAGTAALTGVNGSIVPIGAQLARSDGRLYATSATATISAGVAQVAIVAIEGGNAGDAPAGQTLTFTSPVSGVQALATIATGGLTGGADEEADEALRARLLDRIRRPPHGGSQSDYERWALEVPSVTRAWVYPGATGPGTVTVIFVIDGRDDIIPTLDEVAGVAAHIAALRPVTATVTVIAPVAVPFNVQLQASPASGEVQAAIEGEVADLLRREAEPGGTILVSHLREAISLAEGEQDHRIIVPGGDVTTSLPEILVPGMVSFV